MRNQNGFTLIELMIVIAIIGLLVAIVIPDLIKTKREAEIKACEASLRGMQSSLEVFYTHYKYYPEDIGALRTEGYIADSDMNDPWNKEFRYLSVSEGDGTGNAKGGRGKAATNYLLGSDGFDGKSGTDDDIEAPINRTRHSFKDAKSEASEETSGSSEEIM